jgi:hypothetical protein
MAKSDKIKGMLGNKSPGALRHAVQQVDILKEAAAALTPESTGKEPDIPAVKEEAIKEPDKIDTTSSQEKPIESGDKEKRATKTKHETARTNRSTSRRKPKVFSTKDVQAVLESDKRETERYSFEIYSDQKDDIQTICDLYEQATGKKLSASRLIREVLDTFLPDALKTFESSAKEKPGE